MTFWPEPGSAEYLAPRDCLREPIAEIFEAAQLLSDAANAHLVGDDRNARQLIEAADNVAIRHWIESLWGSRVLYPDKIHYLRVRTDSALPPRLPIAERIKSRGPDKETAVKVIAKFGWNCAYCGIPLVSRAARLRLRTAYPDSLRWGTTNDEKHVAFMCMDNEFDHVLPHSLGGTDDFENLVTCCAPCNCGKENWTLSQLGLRDPRVRTRSKSSWDGLTRLLAS